MTRQGLDLDEPEHRVPHPLDELDAVEAGQDPDAVEGLDGGLPDDEPGGVRDRVGLAGALGQLQAEGKGVRVTFVHDRQTGNKLFADKVWYVASGGQLSAFLLKNAAEDFAKAKGGSVIAFEAARKVTAN